ncbi:hypothetical protein CHLRE_06g281500v5 [Chlamydomonas reinhardtii]|uniref:RAP domain-containing protein n=1 Tax=Chlamydomonas reinhardtii TaxID=3055 RepID=A0A2K3DPN4_CHLRE|nr:uncharacterized protein CHLRE_06g281500v5 [Chlamydomonas reinhardtii]PNW82501.1 hypothetical protein CHLRE_06g281500v5 [Chlamydomonas reinhardtii]
MAVKLDPRRASAASSSSAVDALADRFKALLPQASGREVATVLWSLAKLGRPPPRALLAAVVAEEERRRQLRSPGGAAATGPPAAGGTGYHPLAGATSSIGSSSRGSVGRSDGAGGGTGTGAAAAGPVGLLLADAAPQAVANILWALGTWRAAGPPDLVPALLARTAAALPAFTPHDTAHVLWGLAHVGARPRRALLARLVAHAAAQAPATAPQGLAMMAWACRRLRRHDGAFLRAAAAAFRAQLRAAAPGDVALFAASLAGLRFRCPRLLRDVAEHVAAAAASGGAAGAASGVAPAAGPGAGAAPEARGQAAGGRDGEEPSTSGRSSDGTRTAAAVAAAAASEAGAPWDQAPGLTPSRGWSDHTRTQLLVAFASLRFRHEGAVTALLAAEAAEAARRGGWPGSGTGTDRSSSDSSGAGGAAAERYSGSLRAATFMWCLARLGVGRGAGSVGQAAAEAAGEALLREAGLTEAGAEMEGGLARSRGAGGARWGVQSARPGAVQPSHAAVAAWSAERLGLAAPLRRRLAALASEQLAAVLLRRLEAADSDAERSGLEEELEEEWVQAHRRESEVGDSWASGLESSSRGGRRRLARGLEPELLGAGQLDAAVMTLWVLGRRGPEAAAAEPAAGRLLDAFAAAAPRLLPRLSLRQLPLVVCAYVQLGRGDAGVLGTAADMMLMAPAAAGGVAGGVAAAAAAPGGAAAAGPRAEAGGSRPVAAAQGSGYRGPALGVAVSQDAAEAEAEAGEGGADADDTGALLAAGGGGHSSLQPEFFAAGDLADADQAQVVAMDAEEVEEAESDPGEEEPEPLLEWEDGEEAGVEGLRLLNPDGSGSGTDSDSNSGASASSSSGIGYGGGGGGRGGGGGLLARLPRNGLAMMLWALASSGYASPALMQSAAVAVMRLFAASPPPPRQAPARAQAQAQAQAQGPEQQHEEEDEEDGAGAGEGAGGAGGGGGAAVRSRWAALTLWAFAAADCYSPLLYDTLLAAVLRKVSRLGPGRVAVVLWACAVAGHYQREALERLCAALQHTGGSSTTTTTTTTGGSSTNSADTDTATGAGGGGRSSRGTEGELRLPPASFTQGHWAVAHLTAGVALAWRGPSAAELRALAPRLNRHQAAVLLWSLAVQQLVLAGAGGGRRFAACLRAVLRRLAAPPRRDGEEAREVGEDGGVDGGGGGSGGGGSGVGAAWAAEARAAWQQEDAATPHSGGSSSSSSGSSGSNSSSSGQTGGSATAPAAPVAVTGPPLEAGVALIVAEAVALLLASPYTQVRAEAEAFLQGPGGPRRGTQRPGQAPEMAGEGAAGGRKRSGREGRQNHQHQHQEQWQRQQEQHEALVEQLRGCWQRAQRRRHPLQEAVAVAARQLGYAPRLLRTHPVFPLGLPAAVELTDVATAEGSSVSGGSGGGGGTGGRRAVLLLAERSDFATNDSGQPLGPLFTTVQLLQECGWCVAVVVADQFAALRQPTLRTRYIAHLLAAAAAPDRAPPPLTSTAAAVATAAASQEGPGASM